MEWNSMETAPKDGSRILLKDNEGVIYVAAWIGYNLGLSKTKFYDWVIPESWQDEQGGYFEIYNPVSWTHCPK